MKTFLVVLALVAAAVADTVTSPITLDEVNTEEVNFAEDHDVSKLGLWAQERIVGGSNANAGQFTYQVSLRRSNRHFCGGSIISNRWILSAAHCTWGAGATSVQVVVGTHRLTAGGVMHTSSRIINHGSYNPNTLINDISLIQTGSVISGSNLVTSIALTGTNHGGNFVATLSGWGQTSNPGNIPDILQWINLRTITVADCRSRLSGTILDSHICTLANPGQGACMGDSGGPLVIGGQQVGVVSWGIACARGFPDVFARVFSYRTWITNNAR